MSAFIAFLTNPIVLGISISIIVIVFICLLKRYMQGGKFKKQTAATGKVIIVTGANTGIGKETVRELARRGGIIYMACRDMKKSTEARAEIMQETKDANILCCECDLASLESIRKFVENFRTEQNRLDILINNAGVMGCKRTLTKDGFEMQLGVNHMGHFYLSNLLLDLLKNSIASRIIVVSSMSHAWGKIKVNDLNSEKSYDSNKAYYQSKLANVLFTKKLAKRLEGTNVTVNALHPGVVDTEIVRHIGSFINFFMSFAFKVFFWPFTKTPKNGAQTTLYAALDPDLEKISGQYFSDCRAKAVSRAANDETMAQWLWTVSEEWTMLKV